MSLQRIICNGIDERLIHLNDPCAHELGRVRGVILFEQSTDIANFIDKLKTETTSPIAYRALNQLINSGKAHLISLTKGTYNGGEPHTADDFNEGETRLLWKEYELQFIDPTYRDNAEFWNKAEKRKWYIAWRTETLLHIATTPANILISNPIEDDVNSTVAWNITATWRSNQPPEITEIGSIADFFNPNKDIVIDTRLFTYEFSKQFI